MSWRNPEDEIVNYRKDGRLKHIGARLIESSNVNLEFPKVKDTTSIPRGLLLNRYSRRAG